MSEIKSIQSVLTTYQKAYGAEALKAELSRFMASLETAAAPSSSSEGEKKKPGRPKGSKNKTATDAPSAPASVGDASEAASTTSSEKKKRVWSEEAKASAKAKRAATKAKKALEAAALIPLPTEAEEAAVELVLIDGVSYFFDSASKEVYAAVDDETPGDKVGSYDGKVLTLNA